MCNYIWMALHLSCICLLVCVYIYIYIYMSLPWKSSPRLLSCGDPPYGWQETKNKIQLHTNSPRHKHGAVDMLCLWASVQNFSGRHYQLTLPTLRGCCQAGTFLTFRLIAILSPPLYQQVASSVWQWAVFMSDRWIMTCSRALCHSVHLQWAWACPGTLLRLLVKHCTHDMHYCFYF